YETPRAGDYETPRVGTTRHQTRLRQRGARQCRDLRGVWGTTRHRGRGPRDTHRLRDTKGGTTRHHSLNYETPSGGLRDTKGGTTRHQWRTTRHRMRDYETRSGGTTRHTLWVKPLGISATFSPTTEFAPIPDLI